MAEAQAMIQKRRRRRRGLGLATGFGAAGFVLAAMFGVLAGLGATTFRYAEGAAYFYDDPKGCANCHVMQDHFDSSTPGVDRVIITSPSATIAIRRITSSENT
jgi:hypothetical protein